jgi:hypothetical protein
VEALIVAGAILVILALSYDNRHQDHLWRSRK